MNTYLLLDKVMVKQRDFQKDLQMQLLNQNSDQQLSAGKIKKRRFPIIAVIPDVVYTYIMCVNPCTIATGGTPNGLESGAPNALSNMS